MNTQFSTTPLPSLRRFVGFFLLILPICLALGQSTPVAPPVVYTGTDFSANVTAGPVVNVSSWPVNRLVPQEVPAERLTLTVFPSCCRPCRTLEKPLRNCPLHLWPACLRHRMRPSAASSV